MPLPESFVQHLRDFGYHPRSNKHSNSLAVAIVQDLMQACERLAAEARVGQLVYELNMDIRVGRATWNVDLVFGTPAVSVSAANGNIVKARPSTVRIAVEIKSVMTEHRKAVKNRKRDFEAHHEHVHNYSSRAVAGGVMVINAARQFSSPLRTQLTVHGAGSSVATLVQHCVDEMRNVTESGGRSTYGLDAKSAIVVNFDNVHLNAAQYSAAPPAPQPGDPLHYDSFIQKICDEYTARFR